MLARLVGGAFGEWCMLRGSTGVAICFQRPARKDCLLQKLPCTAARKKATWSKLAGIFDVKVAADGQESAERRRTGQAIMAFLCPNEEMKLGDSR